MLRNRILFLATILGFLPVAPAFAQPSSIYSNAVAPKATDLERLNLRTEWTAYIPMDGRDDSLGPVQWVDGGQVFVQTHSGHLFALDAITGSRQWSFKYPTPFANLYPVGLTDKLVFAVNVNTLYCFHRYSGILEFKYDLPGLDLPGAGGPAAGPVADHQNVYMLLGSTRIACYKYPQLLEAPKTGQVLTGPDGRPLPFTAKPVALTDQVAGRYGSQLNMKIQDIAFERYGVKAPIEQTGSGLGPLQKTPSMSGIPRATPPYTLAREVSTPSIAVLPNVRRPYTLYPTHLQYNQITPSVAVIPPSAAAALALANLRPAAVEPKPLWAAVAPGRVQYQPILTTTTGENQSAAQVWVTTEGRAVFSVSKANGQQQAFQQTSGRIAAPAAGPVALGANTLVGFFAQSDGSLLAMDLPGGTRKVPKVQWRANVGGFLNHKPIPTMKGVYASGDYAGVAKVDYETGDVVWRTEAGADTILAINEEHVYVKDRRGHLLIYSRNIPDNFLTPKVEPVARLDISGFNVDITNEKTDRILIGADNGLLICLRDRSAKYLKPITVPPPSKLPEPKKVAPMPMMPAENN